jgi:rhodanese-related sulfurtransferase
MRYLAEHHDGEPQLLPITTYCTCPDEATSARATRRLQKMGFEATALLAGYEAWKERYPVEPADEQRVAWGAR